MTDSPKFSFVPAADLADHVGAIITVPVTEYRDRTGILRAVILPDWQRSRVRLRLICGDGGTVRDWHVSVAPDTQVMVTLFSN